MDFNEYLAKRLQDPQFKAEYDALEPEFQAIREKLDAEDAQKTKTKQTPKTKAVAV